MSWLYGNFMLHVEDDQDFDQGMFSSIATENFVRNLRREVGDRPLKPRKAEDLKKLLPYIPRVHRELYERIIHNAADGEESE